MRVEALPVLTSTWPDCMISICVFIYMFIWGGLFWDSFCYRPRLSSRSQFLMYHQYLSLVSLAVLSWVSDCSSAWLWLTLLWWLVVLNVSLLASFSSICLLLGSVCRNVWLACHCVLVLNSSVVSVCGGCKYFMRHTFHYCFFHFIAFLFHFLRIF